eukprot:1183623-Ditylum_brightwellii.AAC.1
MWLYLENKKTSEIKVAVILAHDIPANITPMKAIAMRQQTTNERYNECNRAFVKVVQCTGLDIISVAFDGLDAEQTYTSEMMLSILCGNGSIISMVDPNHENIHQ